MTGKTGSRNNIAFTVELFMLFGILLLVIVVITETLVMTRSRSIQARNLTEAVIAAENTMEIISASPDDPATGLSAAENITGVTENDGQIDCETVFDGKDESGKTYRISIFTEKETGAAGEMISYDVEVSLKGEEKALYGLKSAVYERGRD